MKIHQSIDLNTEYTIIKQVQIELPGTGDFHEMTQCDFNGDKGNDSLRNRILYVETLYLNYRYKYTIVYRRLYYIFAFKNVVVFIIMSNRIS